jgi:hypothetical protein
MKDPLKQTDKIIMWAMFAVPVLWLLSMVFKYIETQTVSGIDLIAVIALFILAFSNKYHKKKSRTN